MIIDVTGIILVPGNLGNDSQGSWKKRGIGLLL